MLTVTTAGDWAEVRRRGLLTVVDPMVYRTGEMFLRGRKATGSNDGARAVWSALSQNVDGLMLFFDELMLHDQLPIFDYSATVDDPPGMEMPEIVALVNERSEVLVQVSVGYEASVAARQPAVDQLVALQPVDDALADAVVSELSAFDYRWRPMLPELGVLDERARAIATFRYGALLFAQYAAELSDEWAPLDQQPEHVLQPKRSRLLLATALAPDGGLGIEEAQLFDRLRTVESNPQSGIRGDEVQRAPTFLPYLLSKGPRSPRDLLRIALEERGSGEVRSYRELLARVRAELAAGQIARDPGRARSAHGTDRTTARAATAGRHDAQVLHPGESRGRGRCGPVGKRRRAAADRDGRGRGESRRRARLARAAQSPEAVPSAADAPRRRGGDVSRDRPAPEAALGGRLGGARKARGYPAPTTS